MIRGVAGVGVYHALASGHAFLADAGLFAAGEAAALDRVRPFALALGSWAATGQLTVSYGAAFTYVLGRGLPLPLLGARWRPGAHLHLSVLAPIEVRVGYHGTSLRAGLRSGPSGQLWTVAPSGGAPGGDLVVRAFDVGCFLSSARGAGAFWRIEAGVRGRRTVLAPGGARATEAAPGLYGIVAVGWGGGDGE